MMNHSAQTTLGIDLGSNSVGWTLTLPDGIVAMGSRIFAEGVSAGIEKGREESRGVERREARQLRRQTDRRARRLSKAYNLLAGTGFLPPAAKSSHLALQNLDGELGNRHASQEPGATHTLMYRLRARGLDQKLEADELGRALYSLAQRRGFKSNRKTLAREGEQEGQVKEGIAQFRKDIAESGARTIGEHFSKLDPTKRRIRGLGQWTGRDMFEAEFDLLCTAQQRHHTEVLTDAFVARLREALFYQRPLKPVMPGKCDLETSEYRAPIAHPLNQRIRLVQVVNNLEIVPPTGLGVPEPLTDDQRDLLIERLEVQP
jgi:CRISPR-associated endonuclease Csn1